ncbi:MAG: pyruvate kinase [Kiritimatiellales bacterium]|nr:pyruvate kinase [Kiritimatiellales bacterium]
MHSKQTKIICTIAGNRCEPEFIQELVDNGMNVARLNTAHITPEEATEIVTKIRSVSDRIGILIDTKGPEVRTCDLEESIEVQTGDQVCITNNPSKPGDFKVNYSGFVNDVPVGSRLLIDDGELELTVDHQIDDRLLCTVQNDGAIKNKKSLNVPGLHLELPTLTEKDGEFIDWATRNDIDFIAHSFVRSRDDVMAIQSILDMRKSPIKIIAKIENLEGVENLSSILDVAHSVMVARGDLGIEIPAEEVPVIQKRIIRTCIKRLKPVITATQMLHSMIENPRPTRAEVSDVANAILDGTDALMLSGETAYGKFPAEAVQTMSNIAHAVENQKETPAQETIHVLSTLPGHHLAKAAVACATELPVQAIITSTRSGETALTCASHRGCTPIFALSENPQTVRQLSLCYGVYSAKIDVPETTDELVRVCLSKLLDEGKIDSERLVAFLGGGHIYSHHTNFLQIETPATLLRKQTAHS